MFTMSSSWIITLTTLFRLIAVMCPFKARTLINKRLAVVSLIAIFLFSLISILPIYALLVTKERCTLDRKQIYSGYDINIKSKLLESYIPVLQVLCFYLPWLTSLLLWFFLIRSLRNAERTFAVCVQKDSVYSTGGTSGASNSLYSKRSSSVLQKQNTAKHGDSITSSTANNKKNMNKNQAPLLGLNDDYLGKRNNAQNFNAQNRNRSYNRITLMIVVLCFINLICQLFTFVFIFELVHDRIVLSSYLTFMKTSNTSESNNSTLLMGQKEFLSARMRFPKFLSYSLLLNNIFLGINHSCNLFIYIITNPRFRRSFIHLVKCFKYFLCKKFLFDKIKLIKLKRHHLDDVNSLNGANMNENDDNNNNNNNSRRQKKSSCSSQNNKSILERHTSRHNKQENNKRTKLIKSIIEVENDL